MSGFAARGGFWAVQPWPATAKNRSPKGGRPSALPYPGRQPPDPCNDVARRYSYTYSHDRKASALENRAAQLIVTYDFVRHAGRQSSVLIGRCGLAALDEPAFKCLAGHAAEPLVARSRGA